MLNHGKWIPMKSLTRVILLCFFFFTFLIGKSQLCVEAVPWSFELDNIDSTIPVITLAQPDLSDMDDDSKQELPYAFSKILKADISPEIHGVWMNLEDGRKIWRIHIEAKDALALGLYFTHFSLPGGVSLFVYDEDRKQLKGAFTSHNNRQSGVFATELIIGDEFIIELNIPEYIYDKSFFTIHEVSYAFRGISLIQGKSDFCEIDVNCSPEGDNWQYEKKGVVRIKIKLNGFEYWCSGSLVNNTALDLTPYVLTADHCAFKFNHYATPAEVENWIFYFNYEAENCDDPQPWNGYFSLTGAVKIANGGEQGNEGSDFYLLRLIDNIPNISSVYFNGWSAINEPSSSGVTIHHPDGDIKKISTYNQQLISTGWQGSFLQSHWKVYWVETENNWGVTEGGSSGSPLFNEDGLIIGTLTGGLAGCFNPDDPDYYGKFSYHWDLNGSDDTLQLKPWLDPMNTGSKVLGGTTLGIPDSKPNPDKPIISIYPNPAENWIYVGLERKENENVKIEITDILGNRIFETNFTGNSESYFVNMSIYHPGIYMVKTTCGMYSHIEKLIKR